MIVVISNIVNHVLKKLLHVLINVVAVLEINISKLQKIPVQDNTNQMNTKQMNTKQMNTNQMNTNQMNTKQMNTKQMNTKQMNTKQIILNK